jgi:hypothetical protein
MCTKRNFGKGYADTAKFYPGVRYDPMNAMLLKEFLKEHSKVEQRRRDFEAALAQQQKQIDALTAVVQKVSAQLEPSEAAPQTVVSS